MQGMNILGEALDGLGRWYVAVPPFLIVFFLTALFFLTGAGQSRLQEASERLQMSTERGRAIGEVEGALYKAQSGQRGYLLTGDPQYLAPYKEALAEIDARLERLRLAYNESESGLNSVTALQSLVGRGFGDLAATVALQDSQGPSRATALVKTNVGAEISKVTKGVIGRMRAAEALEHSAAADHWTSSLRLSRWITLIGTVFNMLLVGIASRLVYMDMRRRTLQTAELRDQKLQLEREVEERTRELVELSTHLQSVAEHEKANLARELHDELGGLLVGARMDISWAEQHLASADSSLKQRLNRVQQTLAAGVDIKRRIIEELRPTLLDNVGLFAALQWQLKETCGRAGLKCTENYPHEEPQFTSEASIALFRIAQEGFSNILKHSSARAVDINLDIDCDTTTMRITDDGKGIPAERFRASGSHGLVSIRHRIQALGGKFDVSTPASGGTILTVRIPVARALAPVQMSEAIVS
jgi:signal transduction histidine kinase